MELKRLIFGKKSWLENKDVSMGKRQKNNIDFMVMQVLGLGMNVYESTF
ncbi:hypothetical protein [Marinifilum sp.]